MDAGCSSGPDDEAEMLIELIPVILGMLLLLSPFIAIPMIVGYVVGRLIRDPMSAAVASGLVYLTLFWSSLVTTLIVLLEGDEGAAVGAFVAIMLNVAFFASLLFAVALAFITWRRNSRRMRLQ